MYRLEIMGPVGRQVLEWDPNQLKHRDPNTMKTVAEADRLFREAIAHAAIQSADEVGSPKMTMTGRWHA